MPELQSSLQFPTEAAPQKASPTTMIPMGMGQEFNKLANTSPTNCGTGPSSDILFTHARGFAGATYRLGGGGACSANRRNVICGGVPDAWWDLCDCAQVSTYESSAVDGICSCRLPYQPPRGSPSAVGTLGVEQRA